ncbi:hypothetical protein BJ165DRAFT_1409753 [Panaeolus papilionaceus]|nr:hypothetical protein BJ165DRAFT_1409753 [Panaeolus papilionaceus]
MLLHLALRFIISFLVTILFTEPYAPYAIALMSTLCRRFNLTRDAEGVVDAALQGMGGGQDTEGGGRVSTRTILERVDNHNDDDDDDDTARVSVETPTIAGGGPSAQTPGPHIVQMGALNLNNVGNSIGNTTYHIKLNFNPIPTPTPTPDGTQNRQPTTQDDDAATDPSRSTRSEQQRRRRQRRRDTDATENVRISDGET